MLNTLVSLSLAVAVEGKGHGACRGDAEKLCKGVEPGGGQLVKCLKDHEADLSEGCKIQSSKIKEKFREKREERRESRKAAPGKSAPRPADVPETDTD
ncbi:MAG: hypothetical protein HY075_04170 [Deltaproteobacteria bacterium]|nr:hypothetical protein [Deltaproteobacteria bacterium]